MKTKERIVDEALTLFSIKGFKGTSVKNIADAVGIKDSSLYKHFSSKQEILDTIVQEMRNRIGQMSKQVGLPEEEDYRGAADFFGMLSQVDLQKLSQTIFLFYLQDAFVSRFWRLAHIEQYQNSEVHEVFRSLFMEESIAYQTNLFQVMVEKEIFISANPRVIAMNFYTPIFFLLSKYNGHLEKLEEALECLNQQVQEFYRIYRR